MQIFLKATKFRAKRRNAINAHIKHCETSTQGVVKETFPFRDRWKILRIRLIFNFAPEKRDSSRGAKDGRDVVPLFFPPRTSGKDRNETKGNDRGNFPLRLLFSPDGILTSNRATNRVLPRCQDFLGGGAISAHSCEILMGLVPRRCARIRATARTTWRQQRGNSRSPRDKSAPTCDNNRYPLPT